MLIVYNDAMMQCVTSRTTPFNRLF